jgi:hypothetical protein
VHGDLKKEDIAATKDKKILCRICRNDYQKKYYVKRSSLRKEQYKKYYKKNNDDIKKHHKEYRINNKDRLINNRIARNFIAVTELTDEYVKKAIIHGSNLKYTEVTNEMIQLKRCSMKIKRKIKQKLEGKKDNA